MRSLQTLLAGAVLATAPVVSLTAQDEAASAAEISPVLVELGAIVDQVKAKMRAGDDDAAALAPELAAFDALLAKYPEKNDETAQVAVMKALLHLQVLEDLEAGRAQLERIARDFPGTRAAAAVPGMLAQLERQATAAAAKAALVGQVAPELNFTWSTRDGLTKLSDLRGKVVVLDFWATWCGPCIASFPQVRELTEHYAGADVVVLGVTSLQGAVHGLPGGRIDTKNDPAREMALMHDFIKAKDVTWDIVFSEQEVFNPEYGIQGIPYVAIIAPDGTVRHAGLHPAAPRAEKTEKIDAILREFDLKVPATPDA